MRIDKLTTKFQEALQDAQTLALGNDHAYIEPVHLLVAMLRQFHPLWMNVHFNHAKELTPEAAQALARFLGERLGSAPPCTPVVCFASDTFEPGHLTADNTVVCNASALYSLLVAHAGHLTSDECERIVKVMEQKDS